MKSLHIGMTMFLEYAFLSWIKLYYTISKLKTQNDVQIDFACYLSSLNIFTLT